MSSSLTEYRSSPAEQQRVEDLFALLPARGTYALDIGARDCYLALKLAERFDRVVALDLAKPEIDHPTMRRWKVTLFACHSMTINSMLYFVPRFLNIFRSICWRRHAAKSRVSQKTKW